MRPSRLPLLALWGSERNAEPGTAGYPVRTPGATTEVGVAVIALLAEEASRSGPAGRRIVANAIARCEAAGG